MNQTQNQSNQKPYIVVANREKMSHEQWLDLRRNSIGGSEIAAVVGMSRYRAPLAVWAEKTGVIKKAVEDNEKMLWGRILEGPVKKHFSDVTGYKTIEIPHILASYQYPFLTCNLDGICIDDQGQTCVLEIKTASYATEWENGSIPVEYLLQVQHYLYITGLQSAYIAVLIAGSDFRYQRIERNDNIINAIESRAIEFWINNVQKNLPPTPSAADNDLMTKLFPKANPSTVTLDESFDTMLAEIEDIKKLQKELKEKQDEIEAKIKMALGENEVGLIGEWQVSWKQTNRTLFDSKKAQTMLSEAQIIECTTSSSSRTLRISKKTPKTTKSKK